MIDYKGKELPMFIDNEKLLPIAVPEPASGGRNCTLLGFCVVQGKEGEDWINLSIFKDVIRLTALTYTN